MEFIWWLLALPLIATGFFMAALVFMEGLALAIRMLIGAFVDLW